MSSTLIFATYQNAGIRAFDISNQFAPKEVGCLVPPQPKTLADTRPNRARVIQSADVFVDAQGPDLRHRLQCRIIYSGIQSLKNYALIFCISASETSKLA